jgi:hypothetical protein
MVSVRQRTPDEIRNWAEHQIPVLISCWEELPEVYAEIGSWEVGDAQSYVEEWPLYEMFRLQLETASKQEFLTPHQEQEMDRLRALVELHGAKLRDLLS